MNNGLISEDISKRITSLRFILAVFVVMIHNYFSEQNVIDAALNNQELIFNQSVITKWILLLFSQGICRCAVPLFFMFAAYLQAKKNDSYIELLRKRIKSLLIPYLLWACIYLIYPHLVKILLIHIHPEILQNPNNTILSWKLNDWFHYFVGYGKLDIHGDLGTPGFAVQFWFVRDLLILILLSPIIRFAIKKMPKSYFFILCFSLFCPIKHLFIVRTQSLFFYSLGFYWGIYDFPLLEKIDSISWVESVVCFLLTFIVTWLFYDKLETSYWFMNIAAGVIILKFSKLISQNEKYFLLTKKLAPFSFFFYAIHFLIMICIRPLWLKIFPMKNDFFIFFEYFGVTSLIIFIGLLIGFVLRKYTPPPVFAA